MQYPIQYSLAHCISLFHNCIKKNRSDLKTLAPAFDKVVRFAQYFFLIMFCTNMISDIMQINWVISY